MSNSPEVLPVRHQNEIEYPEAAPAVEATLEAAKTAEPNELMDAVYKYGDRASSFITLYSNFKTYLSLNKKYFVRYVSTEKFCIAANEPLAPHANRAVLIEEFVQKNRENKLGSIVMPVSRALATELSRKKLYAYPVGVEPVFNLKEYLSKDPLLSMPLARTLKRRGAVVKEVKFSELTTELKTQISNLTKDWLNTKQEPLGYLNQVDPLCLAEHKRLFLLFQNSKLLAFLAAVPIPQKNSYFFADYIRTPEAKAGAIELLFIEAMTLLNAQGVNQVSFGLCPLAKVKTLRKGDFRNKLWCLGAQFLFNKMSYPYNFSSIYSFKKKFNPSYWQPQYAVFDRPVDASAVRALLQVHLPGGYINSVLQRTFPKYVKNLNFNTTQSKGYLGVSIVALCLVLHSLRTLIPAVQSFYESYPFKADSFSFLGWLAAPFFHNNSYHLWGDMASYLFFGVILERMSGWKFTAVVTVLGLWASNPVTIALLSPLKYIDPSLWLNVTTEADYGSSNAVYAFVGALAAGLINPRILFVPFALNGLYLCLARQSLLNLHHLTALCMGYVFSKLVQQSFVKRAIPYKNLHSDL